jgi:hypothetical protein
LVTGSIIGNTTMLARMPATTQNQDSLIRVKNSLIGWFSPLLRPKKSLFRCVGNFLVTLLGPLSDLALLGGPARPKR